MIILVDDRENNPFTFPQRSKDIIVKQNRLAVGDYTIGNFETFIAFERKTIGDLIYCLDNDFDRFYRQIHRGKRLVLNFNLMVEETTQEYTGYDFNKSLDQYPIRNERWNIIRLFLKVNTIWGDRERLESSILWHCGQFKGGVAAAINQGLESPDSMPV